MARVPSAGPCRFKKPCGFAACFMMPSRTSFELQRSRRINPVSLLQFSCGMPSAVQTWLRCGLLGSELAGIEVIRPTSPSVSHLRHEIDICASSRRRKNKEKSFDVSFQNNENRIHSNRWMRTGEAIVFNDYETRTGKFFTKLFLACLPRAEHKTPPVCLGWKRCAHNFLFQESRIGKGIRQLVD